MLGLDYNEKVINELRNIPLSFHHIDENHPFYQIPPHWHKPCEIVRVIKGTLTVLVDDDVINITADNILFVNQKVVHGYEPTNCVYEVIDFDPTILLLRTPFCQNSLHVLSNDKTRILPFHPTENRELCAITHKLFALTAQNEERHELLLLSTLYELMGTIYSQHHYTDNVKTTTNATRFKPLLDFIDSSYMNPISSADMARAAGMSQNYFTKIFTNYFGKSPIEFLNTYRLERACVLLINTTLSITEIAHNTGFYDASYFVKVFKRHKNLTPRKYRSMFSGRA